MAAVRPVHITKLKAGDQLRIALKAGFGIEPDHTAVYQHTGKPRRARGYTRTTFYAYLQNNDSTAGTMTLTIQDMVAATGKQYTARIRYSDVLVMQQVIPQGRSVAETAPASHPGAAALGTRMAQLYTQPYLIPVLFVGQ